MRFAIISDIHGNFPALTAVLEDAERNYIAFSAFCRKICRRNRG